MSKPVIKPIFDEWWKKGNIVSASDQHRKDVKEAFYVGIYTAMGLIARINKLPTADAEAVAKNMLEECKHEIMPKSIKFSASIDGQPINRN